MSVIVRPAGNMAYRLSTMARPIDRHSPLPLWAQVLADLRVRLAEGDFVDRFPTDQELMYEYGVSRHTVRDAVRRLQDEGVLERERGRGTFLRSPGIEQPLGALYSLYRSIEDQGFEQRSVVRRLEERTDPEAAAVLKVRPKASLVYLERVRLADGEPIALDCAWLPASIARPLLDVDFEHTALYVELAARCGVAPVEGWERIVPALATADQSRVLTIGARQPVFSIERLTSGPSGPIEWRHGVVRGDRYAFVARWGRGGTLGPAMEATAPARS